MYRLLSFAATVLGVILQLAGLALDAALHAHDTTLAAHEGPFALTNPGHLVFFVGLALTVLGVSATLLVLVLRGPNSVAPGTLGAGRDWRTTTASMAALSVMAVLALAGGALALGGDVFSGDAHGGDQAHHEADGSLAHDAEGQHPDEIDISWEQLRETERMLAEAKAATEKYQDVNRARADGYRPVTGVLSGSAMHFLNQQHLDEGGFDLTRPEYLLYDYADGSYELVGVAYMLLAQSETPPTHFGLLAKWHHHVFRYPCLTTRTWGSPVTTPTTEEACRAVGYVAIPERFWMLHVWLFRPSPEGVFSFENSTVQEVFLVDEESA